MLFLCTRAESRKKEHYAAHFYSEIIDILPTAIDTYGKIGAIRSQAIKKHGNVIAYIKEALLYEFRNLKTHVSAFALQLTAFILNHRNLRAYTTT